MTKTLTITSVDGEAFVVFPKDILEKLHADSGDTLYVTETVDGIQLRTFDQDLAEDMAISDGVMRDNRDLLRKLAE